MTVEGGTGIGVLLSTATPGRIERSSITGNRGGGIRTTAPLAITDSRIEDNGPASGVFAGTDAGGVFADADVYIARSHLGGNRPLALDGQLDRAHYTVRDSTLLDNGVRGILTAVNTTFDGGSALRLEAGSALTNVTLTGAADTQVLVAYRGAIRLANTAIAGRCLLESAVYSGGGNVVTSDSCAAALPDMAITADLALGPLADNGGPTWTRSPLAASPLRGAGAAASCPAFDQRGFARPPASRCDGGAVEVGASAVGAPTPTPHDWANGPRPWSTLQPYATPESVAPRADFGLDVVAQAGGASRALALDGDRAWVSVGAWLVALDRRDAAHPVELGRLRLPELITAIAHDAGSGRLAVRTTDALAVVDGADPSRPTRIAWLPLPAMPGAPSWGERALEGGVAVADGSIAVVSGDDNRWDGDGRMAIWVATIGPGAAPRWRGFARPTISFGNVGGSSPPLAWPIVAGGARAWVGIGSSVAALDVADPDAPLVTGHLDLYARVTSLALAGDRLFAGLIRTAGRPYDDPLIELAVLDPGVGAPTQRTLAPLSMAAADALAADGAGVVALCASCRQPLFQAFARAAGDTLTPGEPIPVARHVRALAVAGDDVVLALGDGGIAARPRARRTARRSAGSGTRPARRPMSSATATGRRGRRPSRRPKAFARPTSRSSNHRCNRSAASRLRRRRTSRGRGRRASAGSTWTGRGPAIWWSPAPACGRSTSRTAQRPACASWSTATSRTRSSTARRPGSSRTAEPRRWTWGRRAAPAASGSCAAPAGGSSGSSSTPTAWSPATRTGPSRRTTRRRRRGRRRPASSAGRPAATTAKPCSTAARSSSPSGPWRSSHGMASAWRRAAHPRSTWACDVPAMPAASRRTGASYGSPTVGTA
ncbi:MAG: right-handed parallel beta-helix repeat-containing protein [Anaerolineae bacterium]